MVTYMIFISAIGAILTIAGVIAVVVERRGDAAAAKPEPGRTVASSPSDTPTTPAAGVAPTRGH